MRDTSLPAVISRGDAMQRRAVGKISASGETTWVDTGSWSGTGFIVAKNILMTNHHVLNSSDVAAAPSSTSRLKWARRMISRSASRSRRDQASAATGWILRSSSLPVRSPARRARLHVRLDRGRNRGIRRDPACARRVLGRRAGERAFIVHHPSGRGRRVSFDDNDVLRITTGVVRYSTDTDTGIFGFSRLRSAGPPDRAASCEYDAIRRNAAKWSEVRRCSTKASRSRPIVTDLEARLGGQEGAMARTGARSGGEAPTRWRGSSARSVAARPSLRTLSASNVVIDFYKGSEDDVDIGFWNIEWLANGYRRS